MLLKPPDFSARDDKWLVSEKEARVSDKLSLSLNQSESHVWIRFRLLFLRCLSDDLGCAACRCHQHQVSLLSDSASFFNHAVCPSLFLHLISPSLWHQSMITPYTAHTQRE